MLTAVTQLPVDPGPAAWNAILPPASRRPSLSKNTTADWVIIGAGFAGLSAARRLSELHPTDRIVVLEASQIAQGPAGRNSGFMIDLPHDLSSDDYGGDADNDARQTRLNRAAIAYALQAGERWQMGDEAIAVSGKINGAITARGVSHNTAYARHLQHLNEPFERLDATTMHELTGTRCYIDGLFTPGTAMLQPALFIRKLAEGIEQCGVTIHEDSAVTALQRSNNTWCVSTPHAQLQTPRVILTVNGHLQSFGYYTKHLIHVFTYGSMTRALSAKESRTLGGEARWALTPADPLGTTVRRISGTGGDRLIVRNRATYNPTMQVNDKQLSGIARDHNKSFAQRFPMLQGIAMEYCWGGRLCMSRNNVSICEELDTGLFAACCQNGLGTAKGTITGKLVAELACGVESPLLEDQRKEAAPRKLPPATLTRLGAEVQLRWSEFRAGREL
ncbi:MAG: FAD-binding oxidoreductase [Pseudomonadota bacterium]